MALNLFNVVFAFDKWNKIKSQLKAIETNFLSYNFFV